MLARLLSSLSLSILLLLMCGVALSICTATRGAFRSFKGIAGITSCRIIDHRLKFIRIRDNIYCSQVPLFQAGSFVASLGGHTFTYMPGSHQTIIKLVLWARTSNSAQQHHFPNEPFGRQSLLWLCHPGRQLQLARVGQ